MTDEEKRYVAEKMLGWKYDADLGIWGLADGWVPIEAGWNLPKFNPDDPEYLGPLWTALCEVVEERRGHQTYANLRTREERSRVWLGVTPASPAWDGEYYDNPNLAVIAAHKALEGK